MAQRNSRHGISFRDTRHVTIVDGEESARYAGVRNVLSSSRMTKWLHTLLRALWLIVVGDYAAIRHPKQDRMDRLLQNARDAGLIQGEVGRDLLILNEIHQDAKWKGRAATPVIVAVVFLVILILLHVPVPNIAFWLILGIAGFMSLVRIGIGLGHDSDGWRFSGDLLRVSRLLRVNRPL